MKKLLFAAYSLDVGGIEKALVNLVNVLQNRGYDITVVLEKKQGIFLNELNKNIKIVLTNEKKRATIMTTTKKAKDKQKTTCQETRNPGRIEKSQRQGCKRN